MAKNAVEHLSLKDQLKQMLEEARVVLPGIQALFGFQLIAVFSTGFGEKLTPSDQRLHFLALGMSALSVAICMTPPALHRQSQPESVSNRLVKICTVLLALGMVPLAAGICLDFYLLGKAILKDAATALWLSVGLAGLLVALWYIMPVCIRGYLKRPSPGPDRPAEGSREPSRTYVA